MTTKNMPIYQQFLNDEAKRDMNKKGKTKKREPGHLYSTLTGGDVYFSTFYRWYEPVYNKSNSWRTYETLIGFKKLDTPITQYWQPWYQEKLTKKSEYFNNGLYWDDKVPARIDSGIVAEIDITDEEILEKHLAKLFNDKTDSRWISSYHLSVGVGLSKESYEMPAWLKNFLIIRGLKVWD